MSETQAPLPPTLGIQHPPPDQALHQPPPDQALAEDPASYSDPELAAYTDAVAHDIMDDVIAHMPIVLPLLGGLQIFMLAFIAVWLA